MTNLWNEKIKEYKDLYDDLIFKVQHVFLVLRILVEIAKTYLSLEYPYPKYTLV